MEASQDNHLSASQWQEKFAILSSQYSNLQTEYAKLKTELDWLKRQLFGQKRERFEPENNGQMQMFDLPRKQAEAKTEQIEYTRKKAEKEDKQKAVRLPLPSHLRREEEVIEPQEDVSRSKKIGEEITEILEYIPGEIFVRKIIRPKYALPQDGGIIIGQLPSLPIPKGNVGPGLLAQLIIAKFADHLPWYRQAQQFSRHGIDIAESTISGWFRSACELMLPLYEELQKQVQQSTYLMADETPIKVLDRQKPKDTHKGYHWVYFAPETGLVCFQYRKGRGREGPKEFLRHFEGAIQTDGYKAYDKFDESENIHLLGCMAHARRYFEKAKENDPARARKALLLFQELYVVERKARQSGLATRERYDLRQKKSLPILAELEAWLKKELTQVTPKSAIGAAIAYSLRLWKRLCRYTDDGRFEIDNNWVENSIRPVAIGRKNYLFAGSHDAAQRAAMIYSFLGSCKKNGVEPFAWLKDVLNRLPDYPVNRLSELLPSNR